MALFQWLIRKPPPTPLERFFRKASLAKVVRAFEDEPNARGLSESYGWLLVCTAYLFLEKAYEEKLVGKGPELVSPNVVLFEAVTFLSSAIETLVTQWAQDEFSLQPDHEVCNNISTAKDLVLGRMSEHWPNVFLNTYASKRVYDGRTLDDGAATLADWLCSNAGLDVPATSPNKSPKIDTMPVTRFCQLFASKMVPAVLETLKRQVTSLVRPDAVETRSSKLRKL